MWRKILVLGLILSCQSPVVAEMVEQAVDGDTLVLQGGERVRLIGVDTPELHHPSKPVMFFAEEAHLFVQSLVQGKEVKLAYDQQKIDKYGRTLAYVYLPDGELLNAEIIRQGYGFAYTRFPFEKMDEFRKHEQEAREQGLGLWRPLTNSPEVSHVVMLYDRLSPEGRELALRVLEELFPSYRKTEVPHEEQEENRSGGLSDGAGDIVDRAVLLPDRTPD